MPKRYRSRAQWTRLIAELESSDQTIAEFARQRNLSKSNVQRWWSRLRREDTAMCQQSSVSFVEVVQTGAAPQQAAVWLEVGAVVLRFGSLPSPSYLGQVARSLAG